MSGGLGLRSALPIYSGKYATSPYEMGQKMDTQMVKILTKTLDSNWVGLGWGGLQVLDISMINASSFPFLFPPLTIASSECTTFATKR